MTPLGLSPQPPIGKSADSAEIVAVEV